MIIEGLGIFFAATYQEWVGFTERCIWYSPEANLLGLHTNRYTSLHARRSRIVYSTESAWKPNGHGSPSLWRESRTCPFFPWRPFLIHPLPKQKFVLRFIMQLTRHLGFHPERIYSVVKDIKGYPAWIPALSRVSFSAPANYTLHISHPPFHLSFTSSVTFKDHSLITAYCNTSPFSHLRCRWQFHQVYPDWALSRVSLHLDYSITHPIYSVALSSIMPKVLPFFLEAFRKRCVELHGPEIKPLDLISSAGNEKERDVLRDLQRKFDAERRWCDEWD